MAVVDLLLVVGLANLGHLLNHGLAETLTERLHQVLELAERNVALASGVECLEGLVQGIERGRQGDLLEQKEG